MHSPAPSQPLGPFADRFEVLDLLTLDPGYTLWKVRETNKPQILYLQVLSQVEASQQNSLQGQWQALQTSANALALQTLAFKTHHSWAMLLGQAPQGMNFPQIKKPLEELSINCLKTSLLDLHQLHQQGLLLLSLNLKTWVLTETSEGPQKLALRLGQIPLFNPLLWGHPVQVDTLWTCPPELITGQGVGFSSDLYSLACQFLYQFSPQVFTTRNSPTQALELHLKGDLAGELPESDGPLTTALRQMLQKNPQDRPQNAAALLKTLDPKFDEYEISNSLPVWAKKRVEARQQTLIFNTLRTLLKNEEVEGFEQIFAATTQTFSGPLEVHRHYLQAEFSHLTQNKTQAQTDLKEAWNQAKSHEDNELKTLLRLNQAKAAIQENNLQAAEHLTETAWQLTDDNSPLLLKTKLGFEMARILKLQGKDSQALEKFHELYQNLGAEIPSHSPLAKAVSPEEQELRFRIQTSLAELLASYGRGAGGLDLILDASFSISNISNDGLLGKRRDAASTLVQIAWCHGACAQWIQAEASLNAARDQLSRVKDLAGVLWVKAHSLALKLTRREIRVSYRILREIKNQLRHIEGSSLHPNPNSFLKLIDLLELQLYLVANANLSEVSESFLEKIQEQAGREREKTFFHAIAWPRLKTCELYATLFGKLKKAERAAEFNQLAQNLKAEMEETLNRLGYPAEAMIKTQSIFSKTVEHKEEAEVDESTLVTQVQLETQRLKKIIVTLKNEIEELKKENQALKEKSSIQKPKPNITPKPKAKITAKATVETKAKTALANEAAQIESALEQHRGNKTLAAKELGLHRRTLFEKIKKYGLENLSFLPGREEILAALASNDQKKAQAAKQLGLSRSSFYRRMKELGIE